MLVTVYADLHLLGPHSMDSITPDPRDGAIYLGDNVDRAYCKPEDLDLADMMIKHYQRNFGDRYISGNHELECGYDNKIITDEFGGRTIFTHGDKLLWKGNHSSTYRSRKAGASTLVRLYKGFIYNVLDRFITFPIQTWQKRKLRNYAKLHKCTTIVIGHWHVNKLTEHLFDGVRIVMVPRGKTEVVV